MIKNDKKFMELLRTYAEYNMDMGFYKAVLEGLEDERDDGFADEEHEERVLKLIKSARKNISSSRNNIQETLDNIIEYLVER